MTKIIYAAFVILVITVFVGCTHDPNSGKVVPEHGGTSVTQYTDSTEIFMEYPALIINNEAKLKAYLKKAWLGQEPCARKARFPCHP